MRLGLYFARAFAATFLLMQVGLVIVVLATTFVENAGYLTRTDDTAGTALRLAVYGSLTFGYQVFPVACFLAALVSGTGLARTGELLAVQAAGVSTMRVGAGFAAVALVITVLGALAGEWLVPRATARFERLQRSERGRGGDPLSRFYQRHTQWFRERDLLLYLPRLELDTRTFPGAVVYRFESGVITAITDAERLVYEDGAWWLIGANVQTIADGAVHASERLRLPLQVSPKDLVDLTGDPRQMQSGDIASLVERRRNAGFDFALYELERHNRLAFPLSALCMFLLALPWTLNPDRRRSLAQNLGAGVIGIAVLLSATQVFRLLGLARRIPPPLGAWGIDVLCLALLPLSAWLYQRYRTRGALL